VIFPHRILTCIGHIRDTTAVHLIRHLAVFTIDINR
jgi:hypothetical protein